MRSKNTYRGENLAKARKALYPSAKSAVKAMRARGCSISYRRYLALEQGEFPDERELRQVSIMVEIEPQTWLFGHAPEVPEHCQALCDTLAGAPPKVRELLKEMTIKGVETANRLDLK